MNLFPNMEKIPKCFNPLITIVPQISNDEWRTPALGEVYGMLFSHVCVQFVFNDVQPVMQWMLFQFSMKQTILMQRWYN